MPELPCSQLDRYLKGLPDKPPCPVYLLYGEEVLYKSAFERLLDSLLPEGKRSLNYDPVSDAEGSIRQAIERSGTFSLQPGRKIVALLDSKVFYGKQDEAKLSGQIREALALNEQKKAARLFISLLRTKDLTLEDIADAERAEKLLGEQPDDGAWIETLKTYCMENKLSIPDSDDASLLEKAVQRGFPKNNHLIITTDVVDKRRSLFKAVLERGLIIDCSVPKGDRREEKIAQEAVLWDMVKSTLFNTGKTLDKDAFLAVCDMTGFDLRTFSHNLEKLADFVGTRSVITVEDVEAVLNRTRKDPIYEFTNAVSERDIPQALALMGSLLSDAIHPLQILTALTNQVRKLISARGFLESPFNRSWQPRMTYAQFKRTVISEIEAYDRKLIDQIQSWYEESAESEKETKKKKKKHSTDLIVARNPQNAYPIFLTLIKAAAFAEPELLHALECLSEADIRIKTTGQNPKIVLEAAIFCICGENG
jgi:DNA polymerase-3 subunit delta